MSNAAEVIDQLTAAGYRPDHCDVIGSGVTGWMDAETILKLTEDPRFANGVFYGFHKDVGAHLQDFRAFSGTFGKGSLQIVVDHHTGRFYSDVDRFNPYADVVGFVGHALAEVLPHWLKGWRA